MMAIFAHKNKSYRTFWEGGDITCGLIGAVHTERLQIVSLNRGVRKLESLLYQIEDHNRDYITTAKSTLFIGVP